MKLNHKFILHLNIKILYLKYKLMGANKQNVNKN